MLIVVVSLVIEPSAIFTSPNVEPEAASTVEVKTPSLPIIFPFVEILLSPIVIVALLLTNEPLVIVISAIVAPDVAVRVPVVLRSLFTKSISLELDVILSPFIVTFPNVTDPVTLRLVLQIIELAVTSPKVDAPEDSIAPILTGI